MAFESIIEISKAEDNARNRISEALQNEQRLTSKARADYEAEYAEKIAQAEKTAETMLKNAAEQAEISAKEYLDSLAIKLAVTAVRAENEFPEGIKLIIGKVVNG